MSKKTYTIPCTWQVSGFVTVRADNLAEAITEAEDANLPEESDYVESSFEINNEMIPYFNKNVTEEECKEFCNFVKF